MVHVASLPFNLLYSSLTFITERRAFAYIAIGTEFYQLAVVKHRLFAGIITYFREGVVLKSYSNYDSVFIKLYSITDGRASTHTIQNLITRRTDELEKSILISPIVQCYKSCTSLKKKNKTRYTYVIYDYHPNHPVPSPSVDYDSKLSILIVHYQLMGRNMESFQ